MQILVNPIKDIFYNLCRESKESITLCAPFVKEDIINDIFTNKHENVKVSLITNVKLNSILHKSLDIPAIKKIVEHDGQVYSRSDLHAKVYIFDNEKVVITSGNLTHNGLVKNFEYGVLIDEEEYVRKSVNDISNIMKDNEVTGFIGYKELLKIVSLYEGIKDIKLPNLPNIEDIILSEDKHVSLNSYSISTQLKGWNKAVFNIIDCFKNDQFILSDVYFHELDLQKKFPKNSHVKAKIRQTLQNLRDLGLIEFIDSGCYRRLWIAIEDKNNLES